MTLKLQVTKRSEKNKEGRNFISASAAHLTDFSSLITEYGMKMMSYRQLSRGCTSVLREQRDPDDLHPDAQRIHSDVVLCNSACLSCGTAWLPLGSEISLGHRRQAADRWVVCLSQTLRWAPVNNFPIRTAGAVCGGNAPQLIVFCYFSLSGAAGRESEQDNFCTARELYQPD